MQAMSVFTTATTERLAVWPQHFAVGPTKQPKVTPGDIGKFQMNDGFKAAKP